ncbi:hypothetical protein J3F84DRAFT_331989 [Trichoderma pleuroticola]
MIPLSLSLLPSSPQPSLFFCLLLLLLLPFLSLPSTCVFSPTSSSFVSVNSIERAVSWLWTGYDSLSSLPHPCFFFPLFCILHAGKPLLS